MSIDQSVKKSKKTNWKTLELKRNNKELLIIGCHHSKKYNNNHKKIESLFNSFIKDKNKKQITVLFEGHPQGNVKNKKSLIQKYQEAGLLYFLSHKEKINSTSLEDDVSRFVKNMHKKDEMILWILLNILNYRKKAILSPNNIKEIKSTLEALGQKMKMTGNGDEIFKKLSLKLKKIYNKKILPEKIEELKNYKLNLKEINKLQSPFLNLTLLNKVGKDFNLARDYFIAEKILTQFKKKSIFCVIGLNHLISIEKVIKKGTI